MGTGGAVRAMWQSEAPLSPGSAARTHCGFNT